jgi:hypothetical protein
MNRFGLAALFAVVAVLGIALESQASGGLFRRCGGCDGCGPAPCATTECAPAPVQYEERKVKVYKSVLKEKDVEVLVCKRVTREEKYTYTVCVPVTTQEKRKVTVCTPVSKQVECVYTVMVPKTVEKKVMCTTYQCVTENIVEKVPVCKTVCVTCVDECGRCHTHRERVTVWEERVRCCVKRIPIVTEKTVMVTVCEAVQQKGTRTVCEIVRTEQEITVKVCTFVHEKREGTRLVCDTVTEKVMRKVHFCETVVTEETVRVPVCAPCATPCSDCGDCGRGHRAGFFRRSSGCCN